MDIKKGQKVWILADFCGLTETDVITVGRKYITVKAWKIRFDKDTFRQVNGSGSGVRLILDLEEYRRRCELQKLRQKLYGYDWYKLDDETLKKVYAIMKDIL